MIVFSFVAIGIGIFCLVAMWNFSDEIDGLNKRFDDLNEDVMRLHDDLMEIKGELKDIQFRYTDDGR
tara:strand:+ start:281 stop:481 length:201 start_codon:yes stop_codon:yes gene_type:complete